MLLFWFEGVGGGGGGGMMGLVGKKWIIFGLHISHLPGLLNRGPRKVRY